MRGGFCIYIGVVLELYLEVCLYIQFQSELVLFSSALCCSDISIYLFLYLFIFLLEQVVPLRIRENFCMYGGYVGEPGSGFSPGA